jgi:hypothetical protein
LQLRAFLEAQHAYERARALRHVFVTALLVASGALWFVAALSGLPTDSPLRWFVLGTWLGLLALALAMPTGDAVRFEVRDTGEGIAREHHGRIFDKFYRVPGARPGGVGLGLYISREIVQAHGGAMGVESEPRGSYRPLRRRPAMEDVTLVRAYRRLRVAERDLAPREQEGMRLVGAERSEGKIRFRAVRAQVRVDGDDALLPREAKELLQVGVGDPVRDPWAPAADPAPHARWSQTTAATRRMASSDRSTSSSVVAQEHTLMRIAVWPCQTVPPHQQVPSRWIPAITRRVRSGSPKDTSTWFSTTSFSTRYRAAAKPSAKQ